MISFHEHQQTDRKNTMISSFLGNELNSFHAVSNWNSTECISQIEPVFDVINTSKCNPTHTLFLSIVLKWSITFNAFRKLSQLLTSSTQANPTHLTPCFPPLFGLIKTSSGVVPGSGLMMRPCPSKFIEFILLMLAFAACFPKIKIDLNIVGRK